MLLLCYRKAKTQKCSLKEESITIKQLSTDVVKSPPITTRTEKLSQSITWILECFSCVLPYRQDRKRWAYQAHLTKKKTQALRVVIITSAPLKIPLETSTLH